MKYIEKRSDIPKSWLDYCNEHDILTDNMEPSEIKKKLEPIFTNRTSPAKEDLRTALVEDQGYICCYCGCRIETDNKTIVEHLKSKKSSPGLILDFNNLLASCDGGQYIRRQNKVNKKTIDCPAHCDYSKEYYDIKISPLMDNCAEFFTFDDEGHILPCNDDLDVKETIKILNLDNPYLNNCRKSAISVYKILANSNNDYNWQEEITRLDIKDANGKYEEFCFVSKSYISNYQI